MVCLQETDSTISSRAPVGSARGGIVGYPSKSKLVIRDNVVYFPALHNPSNRQNEWNDTIDPSPYPMEKFVFFQGIDDKLWRIYINGSGSRQRRSQP